MYQPACRLGFRRGRGQSVPDRGIRSDPMRRQHRVGGVPEAGWVLLPPRPVLETVGGPRTVLDQILRPRKAPCIAPDSRQPFVQLHDEVFEVAFPAPGVIGEEQQFVGSREPDPAREMNSPDVPQESRARAVRRERTNRPEGEAQCQAPQPARLHRRHGGQMVLHAAVVLTLHDRSYRLGRGLAVLGSVRALLAPEHRVRDAQRDSDQDQLGAEHHNGQPPSTPKTQSRQNAQRPEQCAQRRPQQ